MQSPKEMANSIFKAGAKEYVASKCQPEGLSSTDGSDHTRKYFRKPAETDPK